MTVRGYQCKMYLDTNDDFEDPNWLEVESVIDAKLELTQLEVDASHRGAGAFEITEPGLLQARITGQLLWLEDDDLQTQLRNAFNARTPVLVRALTGSEGSANSRGIWGYFNVLSFPTDQQLKELVKVDFVLASSAQRGSVMYVDFDAGGVSVAITGEGEPGAGDASEMD